jgi:hypothetical protein
MYKPILLRDITPQWRDWALRWALKWVENVNKNFSYDAHTFKYVQEHENTHPIRGVTWGELLKAGLMPKLFRVTREFCRIWEERFNDGLQ